MKKLLLIGLLGFTGCTAITEYSRRSEITIKAVAHNAVSEPERTTDATLILHGSNRDVLQAYQSAFSFTLEKLGLSK